MTLGATSINEYPQPDESAQAAREAEAARIEAERAIAQLAAQRAELDRDLTALDAEKAAVESARSRIEQDRLALEADRAELAAQRSALDDRPSLRLVDEANPQPEVVEPTPEPEGGADPDPEYAFEAAAPQEPAASDDHVSAWTAAGTETGWESGMLGSSEPKVSSDLAQLKATLDGLQSRLESPTPPVETSAPVEPAGEPTVDADGETGTVFGRRSDDGHKTVVEGAESKRAESPDIETNTPDPDAVMDAVSKLRKLWGTD